MVQFKDEKPKKKRESLEGLVRGIPGSCELSTCMIFVFFSIFHKTKRDLYQLLEILGASLFDTLAPIMQDQEYILPNSSSFGSFEF